METKGVGIVIFVLLMKNSLVEGRVEGTLSKLCFAEWSKGTLKRLNLMTLQMRTACQRKSEQNLSKGRYICINRCINRRKVLHERNILG